MHSHLSGTPIAVHLGWATSQSHGMVALCLIGAGDEMSILPGNEGEVLRGGERHETGD